MCAIPTAPIGYYDNDDDDDDDDDVDRDYILFLDVLPHYYYIQCIAMSAAVGCSTVFFSLSEKIEKKNTFFFLFL